MQGTEFESQKKHVEFHQNKQNTASSYCIFTKKMPCREVALEKLTVLDLPSFGTERLSRNIGKKLPFYGAQNPKRPQILYTPWWKPETNKADSCSARKDIPHLLCSPEVHDPFNNSSPLIQNQTNFSPATSFRLIILLLLLYDMDVSCHRPFLPGRLKLKCDGTR